MTDTANQLTDHELWLQSTDQANTPFIAMRGNLYWDGSAWVKWNGSRMNALVTVPYDYIALGWTGSNLTTVQYYTGGAGGTLVATLTLAYTGAVLDSVTKT